MIWPENARLAVSIVVNVEEGSEMSIIRGDKGMEPVDELGVFVKAPIRNYGNESNYLYGIKSGAPRVIELLKQSCYMDRCSTITGVFPGTGQSNP